MPDPISSYIADVQRSLQAGIATEHTYRSALEALVEALATGVTAFNDPKRVECGAPDFTVARDAKHGPVTIGYIETKDIDTDLQAIERDAARKSPTDRNGEQLKRYLTLPNLILTDYLEFRWYVDGQRRMSARLAHPIQAGKLQKEPDGAQAVAQLLHAFLDHKPPPIATPKELALRMACLTHHIRDMIVTAFHTGHASTTLRELHRAFEETLVPDLKVPDFADMFAQTLAYGLFAAGVNHDESRGPFRRLGAAAEIPKTNPFLRRLFNAITGTDLDDEPYVGFVDDLAQLLDETDIPAVLADFGKRGVGQDPTLHFYETFLKEYDPQIREMRGVYYTPEPVVSYIVRSVDHLLKTRFGCPQGLADESTVAYTRPGADGEEREETSHRVLILDPACGTGTFLYAVIDLIREQFIRQGNVGMWPGYVRQHLLPRLFGFELMMAPYAVAHLKLAMQLAAQDMPQEQRANWTCDLTDERLGVYLTNTLEQAIASSDLLMAPYISDEANAAVRVKRDLPIMVVLGNPPYSGHSANRSEMIVEVQRTRRIKGQEVLILRGGKPAMVKKAVPTFIGRLLRDYYQVDGQPLGEKNPKWLQDDYVKFIRFGQWRIQQTGAGILAFITNHSYLDNPTFRGMRQQLMQAFTDIYVLDLHGNSKKKEVCPDGSPDKNVFDIQQGVAIGVFIKELGKPGPATVHHADLWGPREGKYHTLLESGVAATDWEELKPSSPFYLFVPRDEAQLDEYENGWKITDIFPINNIAMQTHRDYFVTDMDRKILYTRISTFRNGIISDEQVRTQFNLGEWNVTAARKKVHDDKNWEDRFVSCLWRPFDFRYLYYHKDLIDRPRSQITEPLLQHNMALLAMRQIALQGGCSHFLVANVPSIDRVFYSDKGAASVFPLYLYPSDQEVASGLYAQDERRPNLSPAFIADIEKRLGLTFLPDGAGDLENTFGPEDVSHYIYAVLHSPAYRTRYAGFLKIDFPRIPLTSDVGLFRALCAKGKELVALHLMESPLLNRLITTYPVPGDNLVEKGHPRYLAPGEPDPATGKPLAAGRVYISRDLPKTGKKGQYFDGVPPEVWNFQVGGYQVCEKWLKDRRGRTLSYDDLSHYQKIVVALKETIRLMDEIDAVIPSWPLP